MSETRLPKPTEEKGTVLYVAPNGNDAWSGRLRAPNAKGTNGPLATLAKARDAVRRLKRSRSGRRPITVFVRAGNYFLAEPLVLTPEDSGAPDAPVTYAAYKDEHPVISAGRALTGWRQATLDEKSTWAVEIPEVREGKWFFRELWVNGQRRRRARHPKKGYLKVVETPEAPQEWSKGQSRFRFAEGDLEPWSTLPDADLVVMTRWIESRCGVLEVDVAERVVTLRSPSLFRIEPGDPYYLENAAEFLTEPGEWYLDRKAGVLYYLPLPGEDMNAAEVIAPVHEHVVRLDGKPEAGQFVEHIRFHGLTFSHAEWTLPPDRCGFPQAAHGVPGAIRGDGVRECTIERCNVVHVGTYGIELARGCYHNRIADCTLFDLGAGGIKIGETAIREKKSERTYGNEVVHCTIADGGLIFHSAVGVWCGQSYGNLFARNHIHDFYYSGFSLGWTWGYEESLAKGNIVEFNHVHHIGIRSDGDGPILSDMGGIYTLGIQPGTIIRSNIFHDIAAIKYGGWGIYFDEGSTYIVAENNLVYRTTHGGFHQHYGRENIVRNNIFALGRDQQIQFSRPEPHLSFTFERNVVYWREGNLMAGRAAETKMVFDRNVYWHEGGGEIAFANLSKDEWHAKGMDRNSLVADPLFVDPAAGDFRLKSDSPVSRVAFSPDACVAAARS